MRPVAADLPAGAAFQQRSTSMKPSRSDVLRYHVHRTGKAPLLQLAEA